MAASRQCACALGPVRKTLLASRSDPHWLLTLDLVSRFVFMLFWISLDLGPARDPELKYVRKRY